MAVYTVHEPLPRKDEASADPERFAFVRDGFYFWAFVLGPLWMLWRRLWLVTVLYFALSITLQLGLWQLNASETVKFLVYSNSLTPGSGSPRPARSPLRVRTKRVSRPRLAMSVPNSAVHQTL